MFYADRLIKSLEADLISNKLAGENLKSKLDEANMDLEQRQEDLLRMTDAIGVLQRERNDLQWRNDEFATQMATAMQEIRNLKAAVNGFASQVTELDKQSAAISEKISQLSSVYDSRSKLAEHERYLTVKRAQQQYDLLYHQHVHMTSEKDELQSANQELIDRVYELQRAQESAMVQHAEACRLAEERARRLESEAETLASTKSDNEKLVVKLEEQVANLLEKLRTSEADKVSWLCGLTCFLF